MSMARVAFYTDIITDLATVSVVSGGEAVNFPITAVWDREADVVFKATATTSVIHAVFGTPVTLVGCALIGHNLTGGSAALTNAAGLNQAFTIPSLPEDRIPLDPWIDFTDDPNDTSTTWTLTMNGDGVNPALGEWLLVATWRDCPIMFDPSPQENDLHPTILQTTEAGIQRGFWLSTRSRTLNGEVRDSTGRAFAQSLKRSSAGQTYPFLTIWDTDENDAFYGRLAAIDSTERVLYDWARVPLSIVECVKGIL